MACVKEWEEDDDDEKAPMKLIFPLEHLYTNQFLSFGMLKGGDKTARGILMNAARRGMVVVYLTHFTHHESADDNGAYYGGEWEVTDTETSLDSLVGPHGTLVTKKRIDADLDGELLLCEDVDEFFGDDPDTEDIDVSGV